MNNHLGVGQQPGFRLKMDQVKREIKFPKNRVGVERLLFIFLIWLW